MCILTRRSPESEQYAQLMIKERIAPAERFVVYGGRYSVNFWVEWFAQQPRLKGWSHRETGSFGDVAVVLFQRGNS